jgi:hypothetical protein
MQLCLAHDARQPEQQSVVIQGGLIEALSIGYQYAEDRTQLQQLMPVSIVARQPRSIEAQHQAGFAEANLPDQTLKAVALRTGGTRLPKIIVNDSDALAWPPECYCAIDQMILEFRALLMLTNLTCCGLAYVNIG